MVLLNTSMLHEIVVDTPPNLYPSHFSRSSHFSSLSRWKGLEHCISNVHSSSVSNDGQWRCWRCCLHVPYFMVQDGTYSRTDGQGSGYCLLAFSVFLLSFYSSLTPIALCSLLNQWGDMSWLTFICSTGRESHGLDSVYVVRYPLPRTNCKSWVPTVEYTCRTPHKNAPQVSADKGLKFHLN